MKDGVNLKVKILDTIVKYISKVKLTNVLKDSFPKN